MIITNIKPMRQVAWDNCLNNAKFVAECTEKGLPAMREIVFSFADSEPELFDEEASLIGLLKLKIAVQQHILLEDNLNNFLRDIGQLNLMPVARDTITTLCSQLNDVVAKPGDVFEEGSEDDIIAQMGYDPEDLVGATLEDIFKKYAALLLKNY